MSLSSILFTTGGILFGVFLFRLLYILLTKQETVEKSKKSYILLAIAILEIFAGIYVQYGWDKTVDFCVNTMPHLFSSSKEGATTQEEKDVHVHKANNSKNENEIKATCTTEGSYERVEYCECGEEISREKIITEPLGHDYKEKIIEPTCTDKGYTVFTCVRCGDSYEGDQTEALGHQFDEGICTRCGYEDPDYVKVFDGEAIMEILSQSVASDSGTYANYLGSKTISVFAEEQHNCFSINTAVSYNMWGGNVQDVVFNISELNEIGTLNFKIGGETGSAGSMVVDIFVGQAIGDYPDYSYEIEAAAEPIEASIDITGANSLGIRVTNHSSNQNRLVFFDFSAPNV